MPDTRFYTLRNEYNLWRKLLFGKLILNTELPI